MRGGTPIRGVGAPLEHSARQAMLDKVLEIFLSIPAPLVVAAAFLLPAAETAVFLGLFIPGEVVVIVGILTGPSEILARR